MEKVLWLDMEMTGLDVLEERVIEVAAIVTNMDFEELASYEAIIKQPQEFLDGMDEWNTTHHGQSGLTAKVPEGKEPQKVERELCNFVDQFFGAEKAVLGGNSIYQDRRFIKEYFREFDAMLHYRMLDVTSWKMIFQHKLNIEYSKKENHRALDDIRESISELKYYLECFKVDL